MRWRTTIAALLIGVGIFACGVKGPPVPPHRPPLPAVVDLAGDLADDSVVLTWYLAQPIAGRSADNAAFIVQRSRRRLADPACETCPQVYETVASVPYVDSAAPRYSIRLPLERGFRYLFTVRLESQGNAGPGAPPVRVELPAEEPIPQTEPS